jgi:protein O-GlcNAc transferase
MTSSVPDYHQHAKAHFLDGNYSDAIDFYEQAIATDPEIKSNYWYLGIALILSEQEEEAQTVWLSAIADGIGEEVEEWTRELVEALVEAAQNQASIENYSGEWVLRLYIRENTQNLSDKLTNELHLVLAALRSGRIQSNQVSEAELETSFLPAGYLLCDNGGADCDPSLLLNTCKQVKARSLILGSSFASACIKYYQTKIKRTSNNDQLWCCLGNIYSQDVSTFKEAEIAYKQSILLNPNFAEAYYHYSNLLIAQLNIFRKKELMPLAFRYLQKAVELSPNDTEAYYRIGTLFESQGKFQEAIAYYEKALQINPQHLKAYRRYHLILPVFYDHFEDIQFWRSRYEQGMKSYCDAISLDQLQPRMEALESINCRTNFPLTYQGYDNLELQHQYGRIVQRVMAANYPQWSKPLSMPKLPKNGKLRIGYLSAHLNYHTVGIMGLGFLKCADHRHFEIYTYHIGTVNDHMTEEFRNFSHIFHHIPNHLESLCEQIRADDLHILVFLDIGLDIMTTQIAGLRLAPVQCVWHGHPETTGLPTIDYFLSGDAHESKQAQQHYSEELIRLPKLSNVNYKSSSIPKSHKTRSEMELPEHCPLYLSCQTPFKYLPQHDYLFLEIVKQVPSSKIIFCLGEKHDDLGIRLRHRIQTAFRKSGLDSEEFCIFRDRMEFDDYLNLLLLCDASLDTIGFTGGNTTLQAIACNLPVVTLPIDLMRGRQSYGMFKTLGVIDTVAQSEAEYVEIAVKLGNDRAWRDAIASRIEANHHLLFDDFECVRALERFFIEVVTARQ